jgi:hypothetical protein
VRQASGGDFCHWDGPDLVVHVRVVPRARQAAIAGVRGGRLVVRLPAPPADGKANAELERWLAHWCGVRRGAVRLEQGERSRDKTVRIERPGTLPLVPGDP